VVIECAHCQTRFKLADDKLRPEGTKVRCSKCKEIFTVFPPEGDEQPPAPAPPAPAPPAPAPPAPAPPVTTDEIDFGNLTMDAPPAADESDFSFSMESVADETSSPNSMDMEDIATSSGGFDPADLNISTDDTNPAAPGIELGEFNFDNSTVEPGTQSTPAAVDESNPFGEFDFGEPPAESPVTASTANDDSFGFGTSPAADFDFGDTPTDPAAFSFGGTDATEPSSGSTASDFNFDSMTFGDDSAKAPAAEPERAAPAPAPETMRAAARDSFPPREPESINGSRPGRGGQSSQTKPLQAPLPAPGRRISIVSILLTLVVILVVAVAGAAVYFYFQPGIFDTRKTVSDLISKSATKTEPGKITLTTHSAAYISTQQSGDLFVIRGEALNEFKTPRSAIAVKGVLFNAQGNIIKSQVAYCGNPLSDAILATVPFSKVEESMANQFGDSLANLDVAPGQPIPFTIVFRQLSPDLSTYTVELVEARPTPQ